MSIGCHIPSPYSSSFVGVHWGWAQLAPGWNSFWYCSLAQWYLWPVGSHLLVAVPHRRRCGPVGMVMLLLSSLTDCSPARIPAGPQISLKLAVSGVITCSSHKRTGSSLELSPACEPKKKSWWLCRIHRSSMASQNRILSGVNYVLVHGDEFLYTDQRPQGLMELVFGDDQFLFPTLLPRWLNSPILQAFLAPMCPSSHFGISMYGLLDGIRLGHRLVACWSGFLFKCTLRLPPSSWLSCMIVLRCMLLLCILLLASQGSGMSASRWFISRVATHLSSVGAMLGSM